MPDSRPLLEVENLGKSYRGIPAVAELSFGVAEHSITGLIGPNGSGKSTTLDCLTGFQRSDSGRWSLGGVALAGRALHEIAKAGITRTFQAVRVYEEMTLLENLQVAAGAFDGTNWADQFFCTKRWRSAEDAAIERARELIELVGLAKHTHSFASVLSYGQRKLLQIGAAMMARPRLIMLDEPVAGVNPTMIRHIQDLIRKLRDSGTTFVIVEHNVDFIVSLCDRVIVLDLGRKLAEGPPTIIREDQRVLSAYIGTGRKRKAQDAART